MQLVSDLQQRPNKGRLHMEKNIVMFYDCCALVQLVTFLVHTVTTSVSSKRTFVNNFFLTSNFELSPVLKYKTATCEYNTTRSIYAFTGVTMSLTASGVNDIFVDNAIQMRLAIFVMVVTLLMAATNHVCVEANVFFIKFRSFYLYKDIISAVELLLLGYVLEIGVAAKPSASLLSDYLTACGMKTRVYLPYMNLTPIYVFVGVGYFSYVVALCLYMWNSLPKYGVMTGTEIVEYKDWLRQRNAEIAQSRALIDEAKKAHARLQLMQTSQYHAGPRGSNGASMNMLPGAGMNPYPYNPAMMGMAPYQPNPYLEEMMRQGMLPPGYVAASVPPPQYYGAGLMPSMPPGAYPPGAYPPGAYPPGAYPPQSMMMSQLAPMAASAQFQDQLQLQLQQQQQQLQQQQFQPSQFQQQPPPPLQSEMQSGFYGSQPPVPMAPLQAPPLPGAGEAPNMPRRRMVVPPEGGPAQPASALQAPSF